MLGKNGTSGCKNVVATSAQLAHSTPQNSNENQQNQPERLSININTSLPTFSPIEHNFTEDTRPLLRQRRHCRDYTSTIGERSLYNDRRINFLQFKLILLERPNSFRFVKEALSIPEFAQRKSELPWWTVVLFENFPKLQLPVTDPSLFLNLSILFEFSVGHGDTGMLVFSRGLNCCKSGDTSSRGSFAFEILARFSLLQKKRKPSSVKFSDHTGFWLSFD